MTFRCKWRGALGVQSHGLAVVIQGRVFLAELFIAFAEPAIDVGIGLEPLFHGQVGLLDELLAIGGDIVVLQELVERPRQDRREPGILRPA